MATRIFTAQQGTVGVILPTEPSDIPFAFLVNNTQLGMDAIKGIVSSISMSQDINVQFMHSLNDTIYINVFGNKIGQMTISGILFLSTVCNDDGSKDERPPFETFYNYYLNNNALARPDAISVQLGTGAIFKAFILNFTFQVIDAQTSLGQFTMSLAVVPKTL